MKTCTRRFAIYKPGTPIPGVLHHFAWSGRIPCTGELRCTLCGEREEDVVEDEARETAAILVREFGVEEGIRYAERIAGVRGPLANEYARAADILREESR